MQSNIWLTYREELKELRQHSWALAGLSKWLQEPAMDKLILEMVRKIHENRVRRQLLIRLLEQSG